MAPSLLSLAGGAVLRRRAGLDRRNTAPEIRLGRVLRLSDSACAGTDAHSAGAKYLLGRRHLVCADGDRHAACRRGEPRTQVWPDRGGLCLLSGKMSLRLRVYSNRDIG